MTAHKTIQDTILAWSQTLKSPTLAKHLKTALKNFVVEGLGYATRSMKPREFAQLSQTLKLEDLLKKAIQLYKQKDAFSTFPSPQENFVEFVLALFDFHFNEEVVAGRSAKSTKHNYRSALGRWLRWSTEQLWWQELFPEQMSLVIPPQHGRPQRAKLSTRGAKYGLNPSQWPASFVAEISEYQTFRRTGGRNEARKARRSATKPRTNPKVEVLTESTLKHHGEVISAFLGWYVNIVGRSPEHVSLSLLLEVELIEKYNYWLIYNRSISHSLGIRLVSIAIGIAKWKHFHQTERRNFSDIAVIEALRELRAEWNGEYKLEQEESRTKKWPLKELKHDQLRSIVLYLKQECALYGGKTDKHTGERVKGEKRKPSAVINSWLTYLLVLIFVFLPVRQQEVRSHVLGETIWRKVDEQGKAYYSVSVMHKNFSKTHKRRTYKLPDLLTKELDYWINEIRPMAIEAVQSLDKWLAFVGLRLENAERFEKQLELAQKAYETIGQENSSQEVQALKQQILSLEKKLGTLRSRVSSWEIAKTQLEQNPNALFFKIQDRAFGKPLDEGSLYLKVTRGICRGSFAVLGRQAQTNPHAFRHIAAKHVRLIKRNSTTLSHLMGHSPEMNEEYALQIMNDMDLTADFVDDWWEQE